MPEPRRPLQPGVVVTIGPGADLESRWQAATARLRTVLEESVALTPGLRQAVTRQTAQYRETGAAAIATPADIDAYLATRMTATMAAAGAAMRAVAASLPSWEPRTMVDLGAGTGSAPWAASAIWDTLSSITAIDRSEQMLGRAARLAAVSGIGVLERRSGRSRTCGAPCCHRQTW